MSSKASLLLSAPSKAARGARVFSRCAIQQTGPPEHPGQASESSAHQQRPPKGALTRGLLFFAAGLPLGYGLRHVLNDEHTASASPRDFVTYTLVDKEAISPTSSIFTLKPATGVAIDFHHDQWHRAITSVEFKQPQLQIARQYTLLPPVAGQGPNDLRFLIRKEQNGEVSGYLHRLPVGSDIELRGPYAELVLPSTVRTVVFLAGGTGIAPAMQIAATLEGKADMHILWANRHREDCAGASGDTRQVNTVSGWSLSALWPSPSTPPLLEKTRTHAATGPIVRQLDELRSTATPDQASLKVDYYVDEEGTFIRPHDVANVLRSQRPSEGDLAPDARLLIISGPDGFIKYWAGSKQWADGHEVQGPLGGVLSTLDLHHWQVLKL